MSARACSRFSGVRGVAPQIRPVTPIFSRGAAARAGRATRPPARARAMRWQKVRRPAPDANRDRMPCMVAVLPRAPAPVLRRVAQHSVFLRIAQAQMRYMLAPTDTSNRTGRSQGAPHERRFMTRLSRFRRTGGARCNERCRGTPGTLRSGSTRSSAWPSPPRAIGLAGWLRARRTLDPGALHRLERLRRLAGLDAVSRRSRRSIAATSPRSSRPGSTRSDDEAVRLAFNPLIVDEVMYVRGAKGRLVALDAATGKEIWRSTEEAFDRGVSYWESADRTDRRLMVTSRQRPAPGRRAHRPADHHVRRQRHGRHARRQPAPSAAAPARRPAGSSRTSSSSARRRAKASARRPATSAPTTCAPAHWSGPSTPCPAPVNSATRPGRAKAHEYAGGVNNWGEMTIDAKHGLVFVPLGSPTHDLYGADRAGDNLFGNSLVALDARTGTRKWHFQTVHHDLWDYDLAAAPKLLTVRHQGRRVDIVAQAGKTGFLYVFERADRQAAVADRRAPGARRARSPARCRRPTQPFPTKPAAVRPAVVHGGRRQPVHGCGGAGAAETGRPRGRQRRRSSRRRATSATTSSSPAPGAARTGAAPRPIPPPAWSTCAASRCRAIARWRS